MRSALAAVALVGAATAVPFKFPLSNGFPNVKPGSPELMAIQKQAHGTLPNGPLPKKLAKQTMGDFQVIAENEIFEVAYFTSLLKNITDNAPGYEIIDPFRRDALIKALTAVQAQEELHALGANTILTNAGDQAVQACEYTIPVNKLDDAITLAYTFTDVVLGTLQSVQADFSMDGDGALNPLIGSIIGQEGEQVGFYRAQEKNIPSALPFLTRSAGVFAWSALNQNFIVPNSCPNPPDVPILATLKLTTPPPVQPKDQKLTFTLDNSKSVVDPTNCEALNLVYINQQNIPLVTQAHVTKIEGSTISLEADFPYEKNLLNSLTLAAITKSAGPFADVPSVANDAIAGPGLIEVQ